MGDATICIGTINSGMWITRDIGASWYSPSLERGRYRGERDVRAIAASPSHPNVLYATVEGDRGGSVVLRSDDSGETFGVVGEPLDHAEIWSLAVSPEDPSVLVAGTRPATMLRSEDGGRTWRQLPLKADQECRIGFTRMTTITFTGQSGEIWAGVEIGGVFHSIDHGETWSHHILSGGERLLAADEQWLDERHEDIHSVAALSGGGIAAATPIGFFASDDGAATWRSTRYPATGAMDSSVFYSRSLVVNPADSAVLVGVGVKPPDHGTRGGINRSTDRGLNWEPVSPLLRSVVWALAASPAVPGTVAGACLFGQIVISTDGGRSWRGSPREFGEVRTVAVTAGPGR